IADARGALRAEESLVPIPCSDNRVGIPVMDASGRRFYSPGGDAWNGWAGTRTACAHSPAVRNAVMSATIETETPVIRSPQGEVRERSLSTSPPRWTVWALGA